MSKALYPRSASMSFIQRWLCTRLGIPGLCLSPNSRGCRSERQACRFILGGRPRAISIRLAWRSALRAQLGHSDGPARASRIVMAAVVPFCFNTAFIFPVRVSGPGARKEPPRAPFSAVKPQVVPHSLAWAQAFDQSCDAHPLSTANHS